MPFIVSDEEYQRLTGIESAARNLFHVLQDLTTPPDDHRRRLVELSVYDPVSSGIIQGSLVELGVWLGLTDHSPYKRDRVPRVI